jgi:rhamnosyltransferase
MQSLVTVAIPTFDAGPQFVRTLAAVRSQRLDRELQLLICDSGSSDQTVALARSFNAHVIEIAREEFSHGGTRNLLMERADGEWVAFLTQDAVPASEDWLAGLLSAFQLRPDVGLAFGPYRPQPGASVSVSRELATWFDSFSDDGPRIDVLAPNERDAPPDYFLGQLGFFTDVNGCVARAAWERVHFRPTAYAEDHLLAQDMLRAGFAKVYMPRAAVIHSHSYSTWQWMRRSFDESRAMREVYNWEAPAKPQIAFRNLRGNVAADWRWARAGQARPNILSGAPVIAASLFHHGARTAGTMLGTHVDRLPAGFVRRLSLEGRR